MPRFISRRGKAPMTTSIVSAPAIGQPDPTTRPARPPRLWPALVLVGLYWASAFTISSMEMATFPRFLSRVAGCLLLLLLFPIWWLAASRFSWTDRLLGLGAAMLGGVLTALLA